MTLYLGAHGCINTGANLIGIEHTIKVFLCNQKVALLAAAEATITTKTTPHANSVATALPTMKLTKQPCKNLFANSGVVSTKASVHKRWLPKKLLQAQHFYEGNNLIWMPKQRS